MALLDTLKMARWSQLLYRERRTSQKIPGLAEKSANDTTRTFVGMLVEEEELHLNPHHGNQQAPRWLPNAKCEKVEPKDMFAFFFFFFFFPLTRELW
jgi:site-specific recombinase XerC